MANGCSGQLAGPWMLGDLPYQMGSLLREQNNGKWLFWLAGWTLAVRGPILPDGVPIEKTEQWQMA